MHAPEQHELAEQIGRCGPKLRVVAGAGDVPLGAAATVADRELGPDARVVAELEPGDSKAAARVPLQARVAGAEDRDEVLLVAA